MSALPPHKDTAKPIGALAKAALKRALTGSYESGAITAAEAKRLIPSLTPELSRKKDDGVAEAGLLAYYGIMTIAAR